MSKIEIRLQMIGYGRRNYGKRKFKCGFYKFKRLINTHLPICDHIQSLNDFS